jgi:2-iminobutanoate/2-iminopropanoate deaminase
MPKRVLRPDGLPADEAPYSQLVEADGLVFVAGQLGDDAIGKVVPGGISAEARQMLVNVRARLQLVGLDLSDVVKATVYLVDAADWPAYNEAWIEAFPTDPPTRATVVVAGLALGGRCEMEVIAARR